MLRRISLYIVVLYLALMVLIFLLQRHLLYHPTANLLSTSELQTLGLQYWPVSGADYCGFLNTCVHAPVQGTVMVFHGNAGAASDRLYYTRALSPLGYRVLLIPHKKLWVFEQGGHNNWPRLPQEPWWQEVMQFLH